MMGSDSYTCFGAKTEHTCATFRNIGRFRNILIAITESIVPLFIPQHSNIRGLEHLWFTVHPKKNIFKFTFLLNYS